MADIFTTFTERARLVLTLAQEEAQRLNHNYIGTEHFLLGLVREGEGIAARVLGNLGVQLPEVRSAVERITGRGESMIMGEIGLTPRAKKTIELAVDEARRLNHHYIGTEHLLLGLIRVGEGIAAEVLESRGVRLEQVRAQVIQVVSGGGYARAPERVEPVFTGAPAGPRLNRLVGVLPIAQAQSHDGIEVLALALELYTTGFVVTLQLQAQGRLPFDRGVPDLPLEASDDRGNRYRGESYGGNGGGGPDSFQWRMARRFTPALDPAARELTLEAAAFHWQRPDQQQRRLAPVESRPGPWTFRVPLGEAGTDD